MDNKERKKLEELYTDHDSNVRRTLLGNSQPMFDEKVTQFFRQITLQLLQKVDSAELYNGTIEQYVESQMHVIESTFKNFTESHSDSPYSAFHYSTLQEYESTLEALNSITATQEDKQEEFSTQNERKSNNLEGQKDDDTRENTRQAALLESILNNLIHEIRSVSARTNNVLARSYEDKISYFSSLARNFVEKSAEDFQELLNTHTNEMYEQIQEAVNQYQKEFKEVAGLDKEQENKKGFNESEPMQEPFIQTGPELLAYFKSSDFDINKLTEEQQALYISEYIFGDEKELLAKLTSIAESRNNVPTHPAFSEELSPFLDDTPLPESMPNVSPELRPLSPDELKSYNQRVAAANKELKDKQEKEKSDPDLSKLLDSIPEVFL